MPPEHKFSRLESLTGHKCLNALADARVIIFGVGGVGSWCAEGLVRSGIGHLTVVDPDDVCVTNINRQLQATSLSIGKSKAEEMGKRLREINPAADIAALKRIYNLDTKNSFELNGYDYVIDAIDSLSSKVDLIMNASESGATVFSALGAACKVDPTRVKVSSIWKTDKCRLGKFVRKRLRRWGFKGDFLCVWSDEPEFGVDVSGDDVDYACSMGRIFSTHAGAEIGINEDEGDDVGTNDSNTGDISTGINTNINDNPTNKTINGSMVAVTGVFGFTLSSLVIRDIINGNRRGELGSPAGANISKTNQNGRN